LSVTLRNLTMLPLSKSNQIATVLA
jgi:hypothetical protein